MNKVKQKIYQKIAKIVLKALNQEYPPHLVNDVLMTKINNIKKTKAVYMSDMTEEEYLQKISEDIAGYKKIRKLWNIKQ